MFFRLDQTFFAKFTRSRDTALHVVHYQACKGHNKNIKPGAHKGKSVKASNFSVYSRLTLIAGKTVCFL